MSIQRQLRRGNTTENQNFIGAEGELVYDYEAKSLYIHDGITAGGKRIANYVEIPLDAIESTSIDLAVRLSQHAYDALDLASALDDRTLYLITELKIRAYNTSLALTAQDVNMTYTTP